MNEKMSIQLTSMADRKEVIETNGLIMLNVSPDKKGRVFTFPELEK